MDGELLGRRSAVTEARALYRMIGDENSVEELRALIVVPSIVLRPYDRKMPGEGSENRSRGRKNQPHRAKSL